MSPDRKPLPRGGPGKDHRAARIRWRLKGATDGPVYEGQQEIRPCIGCGARRRDFDNPPPP